MSRLPLNQELYTARLESARNFAESGKLSRSIGLVYEAYLSRVSVGSICEIRTKTGPGTEDVFKAEVIGFTGNKALLMPIDTPKSINNESLVNVVKSSPSIVVNDKFLGRVLNARGEFIDSLEEVEFSRDDTVQPLYSEPFDPIKRKMITEPLDLGIRSLNGLLTCGKGQRVGIFAGSGVGKSVILGMMARNTNADVNVIALIGERGREVREFLERDLGEEGLSRSVIIVATSDASPLLRMRGAYLATSVAEYFRDQGKDVLLMMDSLTRFCMAQREIGLALGEPPATKGYTPSVFSKLPKLLERAGTTSHTGSITGLYTVLVEGDDLDDPIADSARSILDGHVVLSRKLASRNHYPAIDVLQSASRVMSSVASREHIQAAGQVKEWMARYDEAEDLINLGAYVQGSNPALDQAIIAHPRIQSFLKQSVGDKASFDEALGMLNSIVMAVKGQFQAPTGFDEKLTSSSNVGLNF